MKKLFLLVTGALLLVGNNICAQSFHQGSILVSISEGATYTRYATRIKDTHADVKDGDINGDRDPITFEYGVTNKIGVGFNLGTDVIKVDPAFYGLGTGKKVQALMSEVTADVNYHFISCKKYDLSAFASVGVSSVNFNGKEGDHSYEYSATGSIVRIGGKARYYFSRRLGAMAMVSAFSATAITDEKKNTIGAQTATKIMGAAWELGLCYRFRK